jgi:fluoride exporter
MSLLAWIGVAALGTVGAIARFLVDVTIASRAGSGFPFGTLAVNASGALALGLVAGIALTGDALVLVAGGLIGSYTTFSTWMLESQRLGEDGAGRAAIANIVVSVVAGLVAVAVGRAIGRAL